MKLRISGNSLRLRLSRADVAQFGEIGRVEEVLDFGPESRLVYTLESTDSVDAVSARLENGCIRVLIPLHSAREWLLSGETGISASLPGGLSVLIEKDFQCLHRAPDREQETGAFPNPLAPEIAQ